MKTLFLCLLLATCSYGQSPETAARINGSSRTESPERTNLLRELDNSLEQVIAKVSPAVVQILVSGYGPEETHGHTDTMRIVRQHAIGSGVIVDPDGYIMTNAHVVEGAQRVRVVLTLPTPSSEIEPPPTRSEQEYDAKVLGRHKKSDLALLKIEATHLPTISFRGDLRVRQGELVFAIGSPEGLRDSVTMGVVSAVARQTDVNDPMFYIQTDAPLNPGNSGGPLVDADGRFVGINTFMLTEGGGSEGLGFAIPAAIVRFDYENLRRYGHVRRVAIGATAQSITPTLAAGLQLPQRWGVVVVDVKPDGPAAAAGLKIQDIIFTADDRRIETLPALTSALYLHRVDQVVKLEILRGKEKKTLYVPAIEHHDQMDQLLDAVNPENSLVPKLGVLAIDLTGELGSKLSSVLRIPSGVVVVGRAADLITPDTGLQAGDVIHQLNTTPIDSVATLRNAITGLKTGDPVVLQVERDDGLSYVSFEME